MRNELRLHRGTLQRRDYRRSPNPFRQPMPLLMRLGFILAGAAAVLLLGWLVVFGVVTHA
jgi:hypothetical protein